MFKKRIIRESIKYIKDDNNTETDAVIEKLEEHFDDFYEDIRIMVEEERQDKIAAWEYGIPYELQNFPELSELLNEVLTNISGRYFYDYLLSMKSYQDVVEKQVFWSFHNYLVSITDKYVKGVNIANLEDALDNDEFEASTVSEWVDNLKTHVEVEKVANVVL